MNMLPIMKNLRRALRNAHLENKRLNLRINEQSALLQQVNEQLEVAKLDNERFQQQLLDSQTKANTI